MRLEHRDIGDGVTHIDGPDCGCRPWQIEAVFANPPIPLRRWDWAATTDDYEPGDPIGYGETEEAAIADLIEQLRERDDA